MGNVPEIETNNKLTFIGHIGELRHRLLKCVIVLVITIGISFFLTEPYIFPTLISPVKDLLSTGEINLIFTQMTEMIGTYMKVSLAAGIILAMPYLVYQLLMFVSPALTRREKKRVYLLLPWITLMFIAGVAFGYFILIPPATSFLMTFGSNIADPMIKIGNYISIVTRLLVASGAVFETPVIILFLARLGIVKAKMLSSKRRHAIVAAFILAAIITPTFDPINQSLVALPLIVLYEISIWLAKLVQPKEALVVTPAPPP
ncbi:MAG TPA: twin-arginine translocase subunit TatC [Dehalococcoidia bacterium]|nr:twin-arginine translocase subunit TatC [Dehalococcoidia bacterium]